MPQVAPVLTLENARLFGSDKPGEARIFQTNDGKTFETVFQENDGVYFFG
jgi:hypothetical protein